MAEIDDPFTEYFTSVSPKAAAPAPAPVVVPSTAPAVPTGDNQFEEYYRQRTPAPPQAAAPVDYTKMPWSEVAQRAFKKTPESFTSTVKSTIEPFLSPRETIKGLGQVAGGLYSKGRTALGYAPDPARAQQEKMVEAIGEHYGKYFTEPGLKEAIAERPVEALADIGSVASLGGLGAARAPGVIGQVGRAAKTVGEITNPITAPIKAAEAVASAAPVLAKGALSGTSGLSYGTLGDFFQAGKEFKPGILKKALLDEPDPQAAVTKVSDAIRSMRNERQANYLSGKAGLQNQNVPLSFDQMDQALKDVESIAFSGPKKVVKNKEAAAAIQEIENKINEYRQATSPLGSYNNMIAFDELKQAIDDIGAGYRSKPAKEAISKLRNAAKKTVSDHDPNYANIMDEYADASREIAEMERELVGRGSYGATGAPLRKLLGAQKNAYKKSLLQDLEARAPGLGRDLSALEVAQSKIPFWKAVGAGGLGYLFHPAAGIAGAVSSMPQVAAPAMFGLGAAARPAGLATAIAKPALAAEQISKKGIEKYKELSPPINVPARKSGGKVMTAQHMMSKSKLARKKRQSQTKAILEHPDEHVVHALKVANHKLKEGDNGQ